MTINQLIEVENKLNCDDSFKKLKSNEKQMAKQIFKYANKMINSGRKLYSYHDKLKLDNQFLIELSNNSLFKTYSNEANHVTKWLIKNKYISSKSMIYPINCKFISSTLSSSFLKANLPLIDKILDYRDNLFLEYTNDLDIALYIYLRIYHINKINKNDIIKLNIDNIIQIEDEVFLYIVVENEDSKGYKPMSKYYLDEFICKKIVNISSSHIFDKKIELYELELRKYLKEKKLFHYDIKIAIHFEYSYLNNQLDLTLKNYTNYPMLNLHEVDHLYPGIIPKKLLGIERDNFNIYFNLIIKSDDNLDIDDEELDLNARATQYITHNIEAYEELSKCRRVPLDKKELRKYFNYFYAVIENFKSSIKTADDYLYKIFNFVEYLLRKADLDHNNNVIKPSTLKEYLRIIFHYCFHHIIAHGKIDEKVIEIIIKSLNAKIDKKDLYFNSNHTPRTLKTYLRIIKLFLRQQTQYNTNAKIDMAVDVRRSIVFLDEIDTFSKELIRNNKENLRKNNRHEKHKSYKINIHSLFSLLLYYSGLRKTELRTLLTKNILTLQDNQYEIIVNNENFRKTSKVNSELDLTPKSDNAIRKVRFIIKSEKHNNLIKKHIKFLESYSFQFVFPMISEKGTVLKNKPIKNHNIDFLSKKLMTITGRYTPLHSLRHSYATFIILTKYKKTIDYDQFIYSVSNMMGHSEPSVTIQNYIHIQLITILRFFKKDNLIPDLYFDYQIDLN